MKKYLLLVLFSLVPAAQALTPNETCKTCHPLIYSEFHDSAHRKSSIHEDEIHNAVWKMHPHSGMEKYSCADCHTPADEKLLTALKAGQPALPEKSPAQVEEAISCSYCHSIKDIEVHADSYNRNILSDDPKMFFSADSVNRGKKIIFKEEKSFFGMMTTTTGSPYHNIDYTNPGFYTGKVCMGCHAHFENKQGQNVCSAELEADESEEKNCITCHMPKVSGTATTIRITQTHTSHDFAGARNRPDMLAQYILLNARRDDSGFAVTIENKATHKLLLQPLRMAILKVVVKSGGKSQVLKPVPFFRILGKDGKPAMPWVADSIFKDNMINAGETRSIPFSQPVQPGDIVEMEFGYYLVNPKLLEKLDLADSREARKFRILKKAKVTIE
jgi:hypothetical protein